MTQTELLKAALIKTFSNTSKVGRKFSQQFALNKTAQKVAYNPTQEAADPEPTTPSGGDNTPDPNEGGSNEE